MHTYLLGPVHTYLNVAGLDQWIHTYILGCKSICVAPMTLAVKGSVMMMMMIHTWSFIRIYSCICLLTMTIRSLPGRRTFLKNCAAAHIMVCKVEGTVMCTLQKFDCVYWYHHISSIYVALDVYCARNFFEVQFLYPTRTCALMTVVYLNCTMIGWKFRAGHCFMNFLLPLWSLLYVNEFMSVDSLLIVCVCEKLTTLHVNSLFIHFCMSKGDNWSVSCLDEDLIAGAFWNTFKWHLYFLHDDNLFWA